MANEQYSLHQRKYLTMIFFSTTNNFFFENLVHQLQKIIKNYVIGWCQPRCTSQNIAWIIHILTKISTFLGDLPYQYQKMTKIKLFKCSLLIVWNRKQNHIPIYHPFLHLKVLICCSTPLVWSSMEVVYFVLQHFLPLTNDEQSCLLCHNRFPMLLELKYRNNWQEQRLKTET